MKIIEYTRNAQKLDVVKEQRVVLHRLPLLHAVTFYQSQMSLLFKQ